MAQFTSVSKNLGFYLINDTNSGLYKCFTDKTDFKKERNRGEGEEENQARDGEKRGQGREAREVGSATQRSVRALARVTPLPGPLPGVTSPWQRVAPCLGPGERVEVTAAICVRSVWLIMWRMK